MDSDLDLQFAILFVKSLPIFMDCQLFSLWVDEEEVVQFKIHRALTIPVAQDEFAALVAFERKPTGKLEDGQRKKWPLFMLRQLRTLSIPEPVMKFWIESPELLRNALHREFATATQLERRLQKPLLGSTASPVQETRRWKNIARFGIRSWGGLRVQRPFQPMEKRVGERNFTMLS